jgi:hypothetical protein
MSGGHIFHPQPMDVPCNSDKDALSTLSHFPNSQYPPCHTSSLIPFTTTSIFSIPFMFHTVTKHHQRTFGKL